MVSRSLMPAVKFSSFDPKPELARLVKKVPSGPQWIHETKLDGYRILAFIQSGKVVLKSRSGLDWTRKFKNVASEVSRLAADSAVLDGEMVVLDEDGRSSFSRLQNHLSEEAEEGFEYFAFDLLYLNGSDVREAPLLERKRILEALLLKSLKSGKKKKVSIRFSQHVFGEGNQGDAAFESACKKRLEGTISKKASSPYRSGRSSEWVKSKCQNEEEFAVIGYTDPEGSREGFGSLLLGYWKQDQLIYSGRVGTGFNSKTLNSIYKTLRGSEIKGSQLSGQLTRLELRGSHWVKPKLVAQVRYSEWTEDRRLRHPVFLGLREDKKPTEVNRADRALKEN